MKLFGGGKNKNNAEGGPEAGRSSGSSNGGFKFSGGAGGFAGKFGGSGSPDAQQLQQKMHTYTTQHQPYLNKENNYACDPRSWALCSLTTPNQEGYDEKRCDFEATQESVDGIPGNTNPINSTAHAGLRQRGIGIRCKKGLKPEAPNQDSFCFVHWEGDFDLFGVFDGHGMKGHDVSNFVREALTMWFLNDPRRDIDTRNTKEALAEAFTLIQRCIEQSKTIDAQTSGTTATLCYRSHKSNEIFVAHCGDSRAALLMEKKGKIVGVPLTEDHKPNLPEERKRIEKAGGVVLFDGYFNHRVFKKGTIYPGLNMSRAMGDIKGNLEAGISEKPDVRVIDLAGPFGQSIVGVLLCSDGVWEFIDSPEACKILLGNHANGPASALNAQTFDPGAAAEKLAKISYDKWIVDTDGEVTDDITVALHMLGWNP